MADETKQPQGAPEPVRSVPPVAGHARPPAQGSGSRSPAPATGAPSRPHGPPSSGPRTGGGGGGGGRGGPWRGGGGGSGGGGGAGGGQRGGGGPGGQRDNRGRDRGGRGSRDGGDGENRYEERVVKINRCATVVKGGRRFSFSALVVLGDREGSVGIGFGKANEVPPSVEKAMKDARKNFLKVSLKGHTIPHQTAGQFLSSMVVLLPASEGTGIIAGSAVRAVTECAGIKNLLSKVYGSTNPINVVKATMDALKNLRSAQDVGKLRGVEVLQ